MNFAEMLDIYLRARFTLLVVVTPEEERLLQTIKRSASAPTAPA